MDVLRRAGTVIPVLIAIVAVTSCGDHQVANAPSAKSVESTVRSALQLRWPARIDGTTIRFSLPGTDNAVEVSALLAVHRGFVGNVTQVFGRYREVWMLSTADDSSGKLVLQNNRCVKQFRKFILAQSQRRISRGLSPLGYSPVIASASWTPLGVLLSATNVSMYIRGSASKVSFVSARRHYAVQLSRVCSGTACAWFPTEVQW